VTDQETRRDAILVVQDEDVFSEFLMQFPAGQYNVLFAVEPAEALTLCETRDPSLFAFPLHEMGEELRAAVELAREEGAFVLGLRQEEQEPDAAAAAYADRVVSVEDEEGVAAAARDLLQERRARPRVDVTFRVSLGEKGRGTAHDVSATSLRVQLKKALTVGERVPVEIGWGKRPFAFEAEVFRVEKLGTDRFEAVLHVPDEAADTRKYLDRLVRRIMEMDHYLGGGGDPGGLRGPAAWKLARRVEKNIRESRELQALNPQVAEIQDKPEAGLEARYELGDKLATWGVGDVYSATHRLVGQRVAVKRLRPELRDDDTARKRLEQEAKAATVLHSDTVVDVIDHGDDGSGGLYYAMGELTGRTLADALASGFTMNPLEVAAMGLHVVNALILAHRQNIAHNDLCPGNIFLEEKPGQAMKPKLINFAPDLGPEHLDSPFNQGTACRPLAEASIPPGPAADIYALGAVLKSLLPSTPPDIEGHRTLMAAIERACALDPDERFKDVKGLGLELHRSFTQLKVKTRKPSDSRVLEAAQPPAWERPKPPPRKKRPRKGPPPPPPEALRRRRQ
jgi:tRNA A-37 threonylcarbamoyl transferase component Bud32